MSKGLEKIELLKSLANDGRIAYDITKYNEWLKIIEEELKEHEQHKAIENELGIDFITLIKAGKEGIWYKSNGTFYFDHFDISLVNKCFRKYIDYCRSYMSFAFKDYGKTWALTKKELEK